MLLDFKLANAKFDALKTSVKLSGGCGWRGEAVGKSDRRFHTHEMTQHKDQCRLSGKTVSLIAEMRCTEMCVQKFSAILSTHVSVRRVRHTSNKTVNIRCVSEKLRNIKTGVNPFGGSGVTKKKTHSHSGRHATLSKTSVYWLYDMKETELYLSITVVYLKLRCRRNLTKEGIKCPKF